MDEHLWAEQMSGAGGGGGGDGGGDGAVVARARLTADGRAVPLRPTVLMA